MRLKITDELVEKSIKLHFEEELSLTKICEKLNIRRDSLIARLRKRGIKTVNYQNRLQVRENLFNQILTEEDAYWWGFIIADGYISDEGRFELSLNSEDKEHLHKFAKYCNFIGKVVDKQSINNFFRCRIGFATQNLKLNFNSLGIVPRKSLIIEFPKKNLLPKKLIKHFIRGYIDGDGSFNLYNKSYRLNILGTEQLLKSFHKIFIKYKLLEPKDLKIYQKNKISSLSYSATLKGQKDAINILNWLYKDSTIYLKRKFEIYTKICRSLEKFNE